MVALVLLLLVEGPVRLKVSAGPQCPEPQHRLGTIQSPAPSSDVHPVLDQIPAGSLDHSSRDGETSVQVLAVVHVLPILEQIRRTLVRRLSLLLRQPSLGGAST